VATQEADLRMAIFVLIEYQFFEALFGSFLARAFASFDIMSKASIALGYPNLKC
jgi:hypothetical protein